MMINYSGDFHADVQRVQELEAAGLDLVWVPEAYSFDAVSQMGYLAAKTSTIQIGSGILNVYSRTATCMAQTAAGLDFVSGGRFVLGLGASGPQVIEGFHGVPYEKPMARIRDYINVCRMTWRRERVVYDGPAVKIPLPGGEGTGLGKPLKLINHPVREDIPIFWASLMGLSVTATAQHADGWLPIFFDPEKFHTVWGDELKKGTAERDPSLGTLQISAGGMVAIGDELAEPHDEARARGHRDDHEQDGVPGVVGDELAALGHAARGREERTGAGDGDERRRLQHRERDGHVARVLRQLGLARLALLVEGVEVRDDHAQQLRDDRRRDVRHDAEREDRELQQGAAAEEVDQLVQARGALIAREADLNVLEVDERRGDERPQAQDRDDRKREADLATQVGRAEDPPDSSEHVDLP